MTEKENDVVVVRTKEFDLMRYPDKRNLDECRTVTASILIEARDLEEAKLVIDALNEALALRYGYPTDYSVVIHEPSLTLEETEAVGEG